MSRQDREILEHAIHAVAEQAAKANEIVDEAMAAGLDGSHHVVIEAKMLRQEMISLKGDLERHLGQLVLDCSKCGQTVHWVRRARRLRRPLGAPGARAAWGTDGVTPGEILVPPVAG